MMESQVYFEVQTAKKGSILINIRIWLNKELLKWLLIPWNGGGGDNHTLVLI